MTRTRSHWNSGSLASRQRSLCCRPILQELLELTIHFPELQAIAATGLLALRIIVAPNGAKDRSSQGSNPHLDRWPEGARRGKRYQVMDAKVVGLGVRVTHKGTKTFILRPRPQPRPLLAKADRFVNC